MVIGYSADTALLLLAAGASLVCLQWHQHLDFTANQAVRIVTCVNAAKHAAGTESCAQHSTNNDLMSMLCRAAALGPASQRC